MLQNLRFFYDTCEFYVNSEELFLPIIYYVTKQKTQELTSEVDLVRQNSTLHLECVYKYFLPSQSL